MALVCRVMGLLVVAYVLAALATFGAVELVLWWGTR